MKLSKTLKKVVRVEGKRSLACSKIVKLKKSKEFGYLVDVTRA